MASECEKCKKTEFADKVTLKRCGKCKNVFYCTTDCQKADWKAHSYHCRKPDAELRKEKEKGFMGIKNAVQIGVDVDPKTGEFDAKALADRIASDRAVVGKTKVSAPPVPRTWAYERPEDPEVLKGKVEAYERAINMTQLTSGERDAWKALADADKDVLWAVWQLFIEGDTHLPLHRANTRCMAELIKMLGARLEFRYLTDKEKDWIGLAQSDKSRDDEIRTWVKEYTRDVLGIDPEIFGYDCTLFTRFICSRREAYD